MSINQINLERVLLRIEELSNEDKIQNLTIWVGAGVSANEPASLPIGNSLNKFILSNYFINSSDLYNHWQKINSIIQEIPFFGENFQTSEYPRLETVIGSAMYTEQYLFSEGEFQCGFKCFDEIEPNICHIALAILLKKGVNIITSNFDTGIEKAYSRMFGNENSHNHDSDKSFLYERKKHGCVVITKTLNGGEIIHFHGTSLSGYYMGASIANMINSIDSKIHKKLVNCFSEDKVNLFLGYSLSDVYDINEILLEIKDNRNKSINFICNHNGLDKSLNNKVKTLLGNKSFIFNYDTSDFLNKILNIFPINNIYNINKCITKKWHELFLKLTNADFDFKFFATLYLLFQLKIKPELIIKDFDGDAYLGKKYINARKQIESDKIGIWDGHMLDLSRSIKFSDHTDIFNERLINNINKNLTEAYDNIKKTKFISFDDFRPVSNNIKIIIDSLFRNQSIDSTTEIKKIINYALSNSYKKSISMVVYASCLRYKYLLDSIDIINCCNNNDVDISESIANALIKRAFDLYYDFGNMDGVTSCLIYKSISEFVIHGTSFQSNKFTLFAKRIAELNGREKYLDKIKYICNC